MWEDNQSWREFLRDFGGGNLVWGVVRLAIAIPLFAALVLLALTCVTLASWGTGR